MKYISCFVWTVELVQMCNDKILIGKIPVEKQPKRSNAHHKKFQPILVVENIICIIMFGFFF